MLDPELRAFAGASDGLQAERELAALIDSRVTPLVRTIVTRKLRDFGSPRRFQAEDLEDAVADALLVLVARIRRVREAPDAAAIERLDDYTATVAYSTCARHLRQRYPERARLKNRLRYVLEHDAQFALWEAPGAGLQAGRSAWRGAPPDAAVRARLADVAGDRDRWPAEWTAASGDGASLSPLVDAILARAGGPIGFDDLTRLLARICRLEAGAAPAGGEEVERLADSRVGPEALLDQRQATARLWTEIQALPVRQRVALLLNLRDAQGAGLLWILPVTGVASIRAIAGVIEMPAEELAALWSRLPMDDHAIASRLGCSRQQVINLRMSARKRLSHRLGNLAGVSASRIDR